jgi:hypothetical protein
MRKNLLFLRYLILLFTVTSAVSAQADQVTVVRRDEEIKLAVNGRDILRIVRSVEHLPIIFFL